MVTELLEDGELDSMVPESCKPLPPKEQVAKVIKENNLVLLLDDSDASKELTTKVKEFGCQYAILDISKRPVYKEALPDQ